MEEFLCLFSGFFSVFLVCSLFGVGPIGAGPGGGLGDCGSVKCSVVRCFCGRRVVLGNFEA